MRSELLAPGVGVYGHSEGRGPLSTIVQARTWRNALLMGPRFSPRRSTGHDQRQPSYGIHVHPITQLIPPSTGMI